MTDTTHWTKTPAIRLLSGVLWLVMFGAMMTAWFLWPVVFAVFVASTLATVVVRVCILEIETRIP